MTLSQETVGLLGEYLDHLFIANSVSQILFLGLGTWVISRLSVHPLRRLDFLRLKHRDDTLDVIGLTILFVIAVQPIVLLLSWLNAQFPVSDSYLELESSQMEMIKNYLTSDHIILLTLFNVSLVPAVCEEVLFRGYALRMLEKSWGIILAIIVTGLVFGLFHMRITQLLPLAMLGIAFAYITWKSESLYPAIVGHFVNNGSAVLLASYFPEYSAEAMGAPELPSMVLLLPSIIVTFVLIYMIHHRERFTRNQ